MDNLRRREVILLEVPQITPTGMSGDYFNQIYELASIKEGSIPIQDWQAKRRRSPIKRHSVMFPSTIYRHKDNQRIQELEEITARLNSIAASNQTPTIDDVISLYEQAYLLMKGTK